MKSHCSRNEPGRLHEDDGFTLVEILVVILILSILAAIVVFAVQGMEGQSAKSACMSDFKTVETAQEAFKGQTGSDATSIGQLLVQGHSPLGTPVGPWIKDLPGNLTEYVIGIDNGSIPGGTLGNITVQSVNPAHGPQDGNTNCDFA